MSKIHKETSRKPRVGGSGQSSAPNKNRESTPEDMDLSVLDTEPMEDPVMSDSDGTFDEGGAESVLDDDGGSDGASVLDTEPMDYDGVDDDEGEENLDVEVFSSDSRSSAEEDPLGEDEDEDYVAPAVDITLAPGYEIKRIYSDLIDSCRGFEDTVCDEESNKVLKRNITTSGTLFRQMESTLSQSINEGQCSQRTNGVGNSAGEVYMACLHTRMCSTMLKHKAKNIGGVATSFKLDEFLEALRQGSLDQEGGYSVLMAARKLSFTAASCSRTGPKLQTIFGAIDRDELLKDVGSQPIKEKKTRVVRKKDDNESLDITQKEIMNEHIESGTQPDPGTPEALAREVLKSVRGRYKQEGQTPQSLLEIAFSENLSDFISRVFGVAFVVRDGHIGVILPEEASEREQSSALLLKPEIPPSKSLYGNKTDRRQTIVSLSAEFLKNLQKAVISEKNQK